jgi:molecular chaperone DnaK (HSP70)
MSIGIDFGTSNTVVVLASPDGSRGHRLAHDGSSPTAQLSALCFWDERHGSSAVTKRIINEVKGINGGVYDVTSRPPGTIERE